MTGRRVHERFECDLAVVVIHDGTELAATAANISLGGLFIETDATIAYGSSVKVRFRVPALKDEATVDGTVRWEKPDGLGIQFGSLRALEVWALNQYFKGLSRLEDQP
ncbi:MAG: PilZ domain-containing protein [Myxococcota bacterium]